MLVVMRIALELDATLVELLREVRLDASELRAVQRLSRGPGRSPSGADAG